MASKYTYLSGSIKKLRHFLVITNLICIVFSATIIIVGTYLVAQKLQFLAQVYGTQLLAVVGYLSISSGCILFLITFVGCFGALFYNRSLLLIYAVVVALVFFLGLLSAALALVFQYQVYEIVRVYMRESLLVKYGTNMDDPWNNFVTRSWDEIQQNLECCALERRGWMLYRQTFWYRDLPGLQSYDKPYVPYSCCKRKNSWEFIDLRFCQFNSKGPPGLPPYLLKPRNASDSNFDNPSLNTNGCFAAGKDAFIAIAKYFIVIGFILAIIVAVVITSALILYNSI